MKFAFHKDFYESLQILTQKGGKFGQAAAQTIGVLRLAQRKSTLKDVFAGLVTTNHGESRLQHCVKYDLRGACRLITVQHDGLCLLMFAGDHDACDAWLETNKGKRFHLKTSTQGDVIESTRVTDDIGDPARRLATVPDFSAGFLWQKLPQRYFDVLCDGVSADIVNRLKALTSIVSDEELLELALSVGVSERVDIIYDTFDLLRGGQVHEAKARIDRFKGDVTPMEDASPARIDGVISGDEVVLTADVDPMLFEHFVRTASYEKWMLYLHPGQREYVSRDFNGPAKLIGVSGSGKTSVLIHRAIRMAKLYPDEKILVLTLNRALSKLIADLLNSSLGADVPQNLEVRSFWELCREKLLIMEPQNRLVYWDKTAVTNKFAQSEHIDDIWCEYYERKNNNSDAKVLGPLHRTLLARGIYPADYIRQEFDYLRSALAPDDRQCYLKLEREGRAIPLEERYRQGVVDGLSAWERKMLNVGAVDYLGLSAALCKHLDKLRPEYRCILVDEMQDFGTVELRVVRRLVAPAVNDIFLCGDSAQSVLTKYHKLSDAGIDIAGRSHAIRRNYRNSREILGAAFELFQQNKELFAAATDIEILDPEFANFSSSPPLLLSANNLADELAYALGHLNARMDAASVASFKSCIAICGLGQSELEALSKQINLELLTGDTNVVAGKIFLSDLEQTKGFEFDSMIIINCSKDAVPHPWLPVEESYRELCKLYVAMTRAKTELIISYSNAPSRFLERLLEKFTVGTWTDYSEPLEIRNIELVSNRVGMNGELGYGELDADAILFKVEAVGLSGAAQEKLTQLVSGTNRFLNHKQVGWKKFDEFYRAISGSKALRSVNSISESVWAEIKDLNARLAHGVSDAAGEKEQSAH